jgi:hypothetical protein
MKVTTGHLSLKPLLEFAKKHPTIPSGSGNQLQTEYLSLREVLTADVPELPGWHLWGYFDESGRWRSVFVPYEGRQSISARHTVTRDAQR